MSTRISELRHRRYASASRSTGSPASSPSRCVFAQVSGADARTYGGYDLVADARGHASALGPERRTRRQPVARRGRAGRVLRRLRQHLQPGAGRARHCRWRARRRPPRPPTSCSSSSARQATSGSSSPPTAAAAGQSCVEGADAIDTDTTAFVVDQLAAVSPRTGQRRRRDHQAPSAGSSPPRRRTAPSSAAPTRPTPTPTAPAWPPAPSPRADVRAGRPRPPSGSPRSRSATQAAHLAAGRRGRCARLRRRRP